MGRWGYVEIPLLQHVGEPSRPVVKVGDTVARGQRIAERVGKYGANIHSSVSGLVVNISEAIHIDVDGNQPDSFLEIPKTSTKLEAIEEAGVVGAALMGFPAHIKLRADLSAHPSGGCVIANAAECEPGRRHNVKLVEDTPEIVIEGLLHCMDITGAAKGYVAISRGQERAIAAMERACAPHPNIQLMENMAPTYPVGDERVLVRELLGHVLAPGELPQSVGVLVFNVETLKRIAQAIDIRKPVMDKDFTLNGRIADVFLSGEPKVFLDEPMGYPVAKYIEEAGGYQEPYGELVLGGGAFKGYRGVDTEVVTKRMASIFVSMPFSEDRRRFGVLACECGAREDRLGQIVESMGGVVVSESFCKRMEPDEHGRLRCNKPGVCPGQAETVLEFKNQGAQAILVGSCED